MLECVLFSIRVTVTVRFSFGLVKGYAHIAYLYYFPVSVYFASQAHSHIQGI